MAVDALSRYRDLPVIELRKSDGGTTRALPLRRAPIPPPVSAKKRRYVDYEPIDLVARMEYGNEYLYWTILELNGVDYPDQFTPGQTIFIAPLNQITRISRG